MDGIEDKGIGARAPCRRQSVRVVGLWGDCTMPPSWVLSALSDPLPKLCEALKEY